MGNLDGGFNPNDHEPDPLSLDPLPTGIYVAMCVEQEMRLNNDEKGAHIWMRWDVTEGEYKGRRVFGRVTWQNKNEKAVKIGRGQLTAICHAMGITNMNDTSELVIYKKKKTKPIRIRVQFVPAVDKPEEGKSFDASNDVKGYAAVDKNAAKAASTSSKKKNGAAEASSGGSEASGDDGDGETPPWQQEQA